MEINNYEFDYIDIFFLNNKVKFKLDDMDKSVMGIAFIKDECYWIIVNNLFVSCKDLLIDKMVEIISECYLENRSLGLYVLKL